MEEFQMSEADKYRVCIYPARLICDKGNQMNTVCAWSTKPIQVGIISYSQMHRLFALVTGDCRGVYGPSREELLRNNTILQQFALNEEQLLRGKIELILNNKNKAVNLGCNANDVMKLSTGKLNVFCGELNSDTNPNWNQDNINMEKNPQFYQRMARINTMKKNELEKELKVTLYFCVYIKRFCFCLFVLYQKRFVLFYFLLGIKRLVYE